MKTKIYTKILAVITLFGVLGCSDFTEVDTPQSQLTTPDVYKNVETAEAAVTDIYAHIRELGIVSGTLGGVSVLLSCYSDEMQFTSQNTDILQFYDHTMVASNGLLKPMWSNTYTEIYAANMVLEGLANSTAISAADRDRLTGEAYFLRAYLHFYLSNVFGDIPYVTTTNYVANATIGKTPADEVLQKVTVDLLLAETLLPTSYPTAERVRVNKAVATAMLARVYLYRGDWNNAVAKATAVIDNPAYVWVNNPATEFLRQSTSTILALHPGTPGLNAKDGRTFIYSSGPPSKPFLSPQFVASFEAGDLRRTNWVRTVTTAGVNWYMSYKYKKTGATPTSEEYTILLRLPEQYLIRAEAYAHLNQIPAAQADINKIRTKAGLGNTTAVTQAGLLAAVAKERKYELFTEQGHRWFDLKRTGQAATVLSPIKPNWEGTDLLFPLPASELLLNANLLPQNPGY
ncbi:RagB/SusD family nutrient uptake outer membrane protein [Flavobacterium cheonhonense]|uniref:RagB/SusD family nutrient uptake outer membrane protein n=1 Tax=Flavobacterium cheonhonense TaxID=706185 RepID=A0ABP7TJV3_9FLAO|nr:RagB/SusD family nutrient uptake outer membrane protein [Flavobacterium cheonhonense]